MQMLCGFLLVRPLGGRYRGAEGTGGPNGGHVARFALGVFFIVHGLIHILWIIPSPDDEKWPFSITQSSVLKRAPEGLLKAVGWVGALVAIVTFTLAGLGVLGVPGLDAAWQLFAVAGALTSLLLLAFFWHRTFVVGLAIDVGVLLAIYAGWLEWVG